MNKKERQILQKALDSINIVNEPEQKGEAIKIPKSKSGAPALIIAFILENFIGTKNN